jgi:amino acid adenylation domain-containing protein
MRYSRQSDIVVGTSVANRRQKDLEGLIGFFVNTLTMRIDLSENPNFRQVLAQVREVALQAYAHQDLPFEQLVAQLPVERNLSHHPLFQVAFEFQHAPFSTLELPGVSWTPLTLARANAKFDLELTVSEEERGLRCMLVYNTDLFDASTIQRFLEHFQIMLEGIVVAPEQRISNLPLLSPPEREQLLIHCNQTQRDFPAPYHYSHLFAQQVARIPERIAVCDQDEHLTYAALWQRVQQLASELQRMGVRPGTLVGIYLERSNNFLMSVLAIWQCAGAYVPLDPAYPQERLQFIIDQAQISLVITSTAHQRTLPMNSARTLCLEHLLKREPVVDKQTVQLPLLPQQLAYVIYTSGSTGVPKGVMVTHEGMLNHLWSKVTILELEEDDVIAQTASASFDISVWQLLAGLLGAGRVQILPDTISHDPHQLLQAVQEKAISVLQVVPSLLRYMLDEQDSSRYLQTGLRWMIVTGEAMPIDLCQRWWREQGAIRLLNAYGPTECSDDVTHALLNEQEGKGQYWRVPIGFPIANTRLYVLDSYLQPVPTGVPGELYIGGVSLARGYLHRPEITATRFLPDPFHEQAGARLYKTGDLVRYLPDGSLEYLGRLDQQVKLRGYRIELEEIQTVLHQHPDVQHAVVIVREDTPDNKRLTAYYVGRESVTISPTELREHISKQLPDYMIPSVFFQMESLPLTPNGKLDLKALPVPDPDRTAANTIETPHTPIEKALAAIMIEVLGIEQIGITDNFFESGGHSLLATRIIAQVRETFQVELPLRTFFEAPTIAALSQRIETLLKSGSSPLLPALLPAERPQQIPLSFAQQRLWFLQQLEPESSAYNLPAALRLSGSISIEAFTSSIQQVVQRHESLRTTFVFQQSNPVQMITSNAVVQLPLLDLQGLAPDIQEEQILLLALQEAQRPFDLAIGPLMRVRLLRIEEEEHVLLFNMHHIISDGWSAGILIDEITRFYHATVRGEEASLPALPIQYADYALWQREWLQGKRLHEQIDYWQRQLDDVPATLNFPTDRPRPAIQTYVGNQQEMMLPIALSHELEALGQREGATLFMTLLASFQILLQRYSGQHDIVVGTSVANRRQKDLEGLIGCFINTLPLRTDLSGDPSFREVLVRVRDVALHAYAHQDLPFEQLVAQLPVERDLSQQPLFQVAFEFQNFPFTTLDIAGVSWSPLEFARTTSKFDLELTLALHEQGLRCVLEYNTDLFEAGTIRRFLNHFQTLLEGIVRAPEQRISNLPLLSTSEREQLLIHGNQTQQELPSPSHYTLLLADQAARTPDRIAACDQQQQLTYAGLWQRAQRLASLLQRQGVGPETLVGLYLERSCSLLVSILAIWQCGAAYVPLDPAYPRERLRLILEQSQVPLLLTTNALQANIPTEDTRLLCLEDLLIQELVENPPLASVPLLPQYLAYVIYTSGSTGTPKGVMISHEGMLNHLWAKIETLGIGETDIVAQTASQCFDISVWQLLAGLLQGGQVQIFPDAISHDSSYLLRAAQQGAVSILQLVPSQLRLILDDLALHPAFQWNVRWLIVTGEAMPLSLCQRWWHQQGAIRLLNAYGPTECSDDVTHALLEEETTLTRVPIGSPIANTRIYVLDEHLEPVPQGVIGEIYVGGRGVGRGYLRDAKRTADVFVPDPYGIEPGGRLYRTGDRGRYREDGQLEFVERQDEQVKLRGYRIELGEIEAVLGQHPQVKQCVVLLQETKMQEKQIVAYVVTQEEEEITPNRQAMLRNYLKEKLPPYMIPAHFLLLDALPLTANGKVNRKNLLALSWKQEEQQEGKQIKLLLSPIEELVLQCWRQVLQQEQLEIHEDFFEVGGHSLLATQVVAHLQQTMGIEIPLRTLFEAPTVAEFAAWLTQQLRQGQRLSAPAIVSGPRNHELPLSFAQQRLWFQDQLEPGNTAYSIPTAVRLRGRLDRAALKQALARVIERHEILRTTFPTCEGQPVLQIAAEPTTRQILVDLSYLAQEERESVAQHLALQEAEQPFDLARGPLLRFWLLSLSQEDHIVLLTMHHIISDGWSINILVNELTNLYTALEQGEAASLPELPVQYADYALWQRSWLQGEVLQQQLDYWKQQLANIVTLALPTDYPRPPIQTFQAAQQRLFLPDELSQKVRELSQREGVTLFMTMLAAFNVLLHYYTGQDDLVIGTNVANRNRAETEELIGFFVNQLVLRTQLSGNPGFREILHRVKETALGAYVHQDLPFDRLLMELNPERDLSRTPLFQVKFALEHVPTQETALPNIRVESVKFEQETTKFDIFLNLFESNGKLFGTLEYRTDLFRLETIARFLHLFEVVTTQVIAFPDMPLQEIIAVVTELDAENRSGQEKERRLRNVQKLGQVRRRAKQQVEPQ